MILNTKIILCVKHKTVRCGVTDPAARGGTARGAGEARTGTGGLGSLSHSPLGDSRVLCTTGPVPLEAALRHTLTRCLFQSLVSLNQGHRQRHQAEQSSVTSGVPPPLQLQTMAGVAWSLGVTWCFGRQLGLGVKGAIWGATGVKGTREPGEKVRYRRRGGTRKLLLERKGSPLGFSCAWAKAADPGVGRGYCRKAGRKVPR